MKKLKENSGLISLIISSITLVFVVVLSVLFFVNLNKKGTKDYSQFRIYVGTNDKDTYLPMDPGVAKSKVDNICLEYFNDGFTLYEATGSWKNEDETVTHEYTLVVYVSGVTIERVHQASDKMIVELNQSTILIESYDLPVEFYTGSNS